MMVIDSILRSFVRFVIRSCRALVCLARKAARFLERRERESEIRNDVRPAYSMALHLTVSRIWVVALSFEWRRWTV
jgi:hypothetical protein